MNNSKKYICLCGESFRKKNYFENHKKICTYKYIIDSKVIIDNNNNINLVIKNRIDLVIGIEYVDYYENTYNTDFFKDLHIEYKRAWNGLNEDNCEGKKEHLERFNNLINDIKDKQTNIVEVIIYNYFYDISLFIFNIIN